MKKLIVFFMLLQVAAYSQTNMITELCKSEVATPVITISNPHESLFYDNFKGSWDLIITFTPTEAEVTALLKNFPTGSTATIRFRVRGNVYSTTGIVGYTKQSGVKYSIEIKGVQLIKFN